jgi:hypothetical protein
MAKWKFEIAYTVEADTLQSAFGALFIQLGRALVETDTENPVNEHALRVEISEIISVGSLGDDDSLTEDDADVLH